MEINLGFYEYYKFNKKEFYSLLTKEERKEFHEGIAKLIKTVKELKKKYTVNNKIKKVEVFVTSNLIGILTRTTYKVNNIAKEKEYNTITPTEYSNIYDKLQKHWIGVLKRNGYDNSVSYKVEDFNDNTMI